MRALHSAELGEPVGLDTVRRMGSRGEFFRAVLTGPRGFQRQVALKRLPFGSLSVRSLRRCFAEVGRLTRIQHPNLAKVEDLLVTDQRYYLVLELLDGCDLAELKRGRERIPDGAAAALIAQAAAGLACAHAARPESGLEAGLCHGDLRPESIFVCRDGTVKILDLGLERLCRLVGEAVSQERQRGCEFLSPEQARGEVTDARSDRYQLGAVLFYLLAGRPPHVGVGAGVGELVRNIASAEPASLDKLRPDLLPGLSRLVARALERDPARRFADTPSLSAAAAAVAAELGSSDNTSLAHLVAGIWSSAAEHEPTTRWQRQTAAPETEMPAAPGAAPGDALAGRALGDFIVREKIGEGGFGAVYLADQPLLGREAVIKVLHARHRSSQDLIQRFLREARLASLLDHPYAAHIYAFGAEPDGVLWLAMERVHGTTLEQMLAIQGPLPLERFVPLLERICEVVYTAHERGIVHRDLKPPNVMVLWRAGRLLPKLLDFGIAKLASEAALAERTPSGVPVALPLTAGGTRMGSPHYMAPEQWSCAASSDARADLYALGVLTYQALTGRLPFDGETPEVLLERHRNQPVPALGDDFPEALQGVLERALAKQPEERYATALDYAAALRAAAGLGAEAESLPQLDDARRQAVLGGAPQPIADAVAAIESARNLHQARDAIGHAVQSVVRYLGLLALASRSRIGPLACGDSPSAGAALRALRTRRLSDEEWLELGRELTRPFLALREAHPIPEMVSFFFVPGGEGAAAAATLGRLLEMRAGAEQTGHNELELRELLLRALPELDRVLDAADFVRDYQLVVPRGDVGERWMGVRRTGRTTVRLRGPYPSGQPLLLDRAGCPVLLLWPLVQVARPAPAAAEELFWFDGAGRRGGRLVALPFGFERHDGAAGDLLLELAPPPDDAGAPLAELPAPYRGLTAYSAGDAAEFIGREREAEALIHRLRAEPLLLVVGPSGSGKSSFVQAGVIPSLPPGWQAITLRPSVAPIAALAARLELAGIVVPELEAMLEARPEALGELLRAHARAHHLTLVLVIDAFEEVIALCPDAPERHRFATALAAAARAPEDPVRVVCTLRDDFLGRAQQLPALKQRLTHSIHLIGCLGPEELLRILVEPARRAGYAFEDDQLPREMVREVAAEPAALALLSFTAARLWELRDRHFRRLPRPAYHALGGVGGALSRHAEATLCELGPARRHLVRDLFRQLMTSDGTRASVSRTELNQLFGESARDADEVLERLVAARLLVASEGEQGEQRIEVVHEALLSAWPRLVAWRREDAEGARLRDELRAAARQWDKHGRARGLLWQSEALTEYRLWRARCPVPLTTVEESFAAASLREAARGRRARRLAVAGMVAALILGLSVLSRQRSAAQASAEQARVRLLVGYEQEGRQAILAGDPTRGIVYLSEALNLGGDSPATRFLLARATASLSHERLSIDAHAGQVYTAVFSPDGSRLLTAGQDRAAKIWDVATGRLLFNLEGHADTIWHAEFSADGSQLLTASSDGTVRIWETATGRLRFSLSHRDRVYYAAFDRRGDRLVTASDDRQARIWSARSGELQLTLSAHQGPVRDARFNHDGSRVVTASFDKTARVWDAVTGKLQRTLRGHSQRVQSALFSPDGTRVLTTAFDRTAKLWDARSGVLLHTLQGHLDALSTAAFSPDGDRIVTASFDRTAKLWDTATGALLASLDHAGSVFSVSFSGDGGRILTVSHDGTARLWDGGKGTLLSSFVGHLDALFAGGFSPDGRLAVTASQDRKVKIWDTRPDDLLMSVKGHEAAVASAVFSRDGRRTLTAGDDRTAKIWDVRDGRAIATFKDAAGLRAVAFSPNEQRPLNLDARTIAVGRGWLLRLGQNGNLELREQDSGRLRWSVQGHQVAVRSADFSLDAGSVVTASNDGTARVWDAPSGRVLQTLRGHNGPVVSARFSSNGKWIATGSVDRTAKLWDAQTGGLVLSFDGHTNMVWSATVSHDGRLVATASEDGTARLWDASDGKLLMIKPGHNRAVRVAEFSPDDARLLTASADGSAEIWDIRIDLRSPQEVREWVESRVPFRLVMGHLVRAQLFPSDRR